MNYLKQLCTQVFLIFICLVNTLTLAHAAKISKSEIIEISKAKFQQIEKLQLPSEQQSEWLALYIDNLCQLNKEIKSYSKLIDEQSIYYPELRDKKFNELKKVYSETHQLLKYKNTTLCDILESY